MRESLDTSAYVFQTTANFDKQRVANERKLEHTREYLEGMEAEELEL